MILSSLLYVLEPLPVSAQSQQQRGILFHTPSSSVTQLDLKLFLFLRLHSVEAGGPQLCYKKHIQHNSVGLSSDSYTALEWGPAGLTMVWPPVLLCACAHGVFPGESRA